MSDMISAMDGPSFTDMRPLTVATVIEFSKCSSAFRKRSSSAADQRRRTRLPIRSFLGAPLHGACYWWPGCFTSRRLGQKDLGCCRLAHWHLALTAGGVVTNAFGVFCAAHHVYSGAAVLLPKNVSHIFHRRWPSRPGSIGGTGTPLAVELADQRTLRHVPPQFRGVAFLKRFRIAVHRYQWLISL
jgi:hypothetical protein